MNMARLNTCNKFNELQNQAKFKNKTKQNYQINK